MNQTISKILSHGKDDVLSDIGTSQNSNDNPLVLPYSKGKIIALLIESLIIVLGFVSVVIYNWLQNASISPLLGAVVGAVNGSLIAWCITHENKSNKK